MILIIGEVRDHAIEAFHAALERHASEHIRESLRERVDGNVKEIVEALLSDGWHAPHAQALRRTARPQLVYSLVRGQGIELVIEDPKTGAQAGVTGSVALIQPGGLVNMAGRVHVRGQARQLPAVSPGQAD